MVIHQIVLRSLALDQRGEASKIVTPMPKAVPLARFKKKKKVGRESSIQFYINQVQINATVDQSCQTRDEKTDNK